MKVYKEEQTLDQWRCARCRQGARSTDRIHYVRFPNASGESALFCNACWPQTTIAERLAAYAADRNPEYPWEDMAATLWKGVATE